MKRGILMAKKKTVVKAGLGYTIGNYLIKGLTFLTIPVFSRLLSTTEYGRYNTFVAYENILFIIVGFAIHTSYKNARYKYNLSTEGANRGHDYYAYVSETVVFTLLSFVFWLVFVNATSTLTSRLLDLDNISINLLVIYSAGAVIISCFNADVALEYSYKKFLAVSGFNAICNIGLSLIFVLTIFKTNRYIGYTLGTVIPIIIASIYIIEYFFKRSKPSKDKQMLFWGIKFSLPIIPHGLSQVVLNQFDRIMISRMVSSAVTGIYSFAYNIYSIVAVTFESLDNVWAPWFYENMHARNYDKIKKYSSIYVCVMFNFCTIVMLICPEIIRILGNKNYWNAMYSAIPIVAGGFFSFLCTIPASVEYYHEKTNFIALGTSVAAIINIILNFIFIKLFGYIAAAYTTLVTYVLYFLFHYYLARKIEDINLFSDKVILGCSVGIIIVMFTTNIIIKFWIIRWMIAILIFCVGLYYEERIVGYVRKKIM